MRGKTEDSPWIRLTGGIKHCGPQGDERDVGRGEDGAGKLQRGTEPELKPAELVTSAVQNVPLPLELGTPLDQADLTAPPRRQARARPGPRADVGRTGEDRRGSGPSSCAAFSPSFDPLHT